MKKKIGLLLRIHAVLGIFNVLYNYEYYLASLFYLDVSLGLLSGIIFIYLEFLIANLLIRGASPNIDSSKKTPPAKKTPLSKKTPPAKKTPLSKKTPPAKKTPLSKKTPLLKANLISGTFDPAKDTQMFSGYMMNLFREELKEFKSSSYQLIHGNFLSPPDHMQLISKLNLTKDSLLKTLPELLEKTPDNNRKTFLEMAWGTMIEESMSIELENFLNENDIKLIQ